MERRRFVPRSEGLEARELLSVAGARPPAAPRPAVDTPVVLETPVEEPPVPAGVLPPESFQTTAAVPATAEAAREVRPAVERTRITVNPDDPNIAPLRRFRIDRLPALLASVHPGRVVPPEIVADLQEDLRLIADRLVPAPSNALYAFNLQLRSTLGRPSLRVEEAAALNRLFGLILDRAGAEPDVVAQFQEDMNALAHFNVQSRTPAIDTANDYALMLQTALGVGIDFDAFQRRPRPRALAPGTAGASPALGL